MLGDEGANGEDGADTMLDEDDVEDDDGTDQGYNFGRSASVASVMMAKSILPGPRSMVNKGRGSMLVRNVHKLSWQLDDEDEEGLDNVNHLDIVLPSALDEAIALTSSVNSFIIQTLDSAFLSTGKSLSLSLYCIVLYRVIH